MSHSPLPESPQPDIQSAAPAPLRAPYTPPRVQDLGAWEAVTLAYSLPIGPGGYLRPGQFDDSLF
ncbi:hypothetical protein Dcar01_00682 [Deinococcus carri]|uniref:Uncharacterized protein n=1 Tax=Deinococcus carri TaxID=1211323 RepID=A0ABP9W618_9DEIO